MDAKALNQFTQGLWDREITPALIDYIRIPAKSPAFDPDWAKSGFIDQAVEHMAGWARGKIASLPGATMEIVRLEGRTPVIFIEAPGDIDDTVLLYGHLDKQPEMTGWSDGLGPWEPVIRDDKLYGRGGADDGYAIYASVTALLALQDQGVKRARCVVLIEACEESGSYDLPFYVDHLAERIGSPSLVICLDSGCGNYDQLWLTTSLRGLAGGLLTVEVLEEGVHSGDASGVVPDSFRIARAAVAAGGRDHRPDPPRPLQRGYPRRPQGPGEGRGSGPGGGRLAQVPPRRRHHATEHRPAGADPQPHLAPGAHRHRSGRPAAAEVGGQRASARHRAGSERAHPADRRPAGLRPNAGTDPDRRSAAARQGDVPDRPGEPGLERPAASAVA